MPFLRIFISLALIIILLYIMRDKYGDILKALKSAKIAMFSLGLVAFFLAITVASLRLKIIIAAQDIPVTLFEALSLTFIGYFFNNFLPTAIGGDVVKAYYLSKKTSDKIGSYTSVFVDRAVGLFTMIFMAFAALFFVGNKVIDQTVRYMIYAITAVSIVAIVFMVNRNFAKKFSLLLTLIRPIEEKIRKAYGSVNKYRHHKMLMLNSLVISIVSQILFFTSIGILALSIGSYIPAMEILLRMPIISAMSLLPSINGLGLREGSTVLLFGPIINKENAFAVSILWLLVLFITSVIGGLVYMVSPQFRVRLAEIE